MINASISEIEFHLPEKILTNTDLAQLFPEWDSEKIRKKTGILKRYIAASDEFASDLAIKAAQKILDRTPSLRKKIDYVILCTQSPDYHLPTSACLIQEALSLSCNLGAIDINLGCSGYIYGLSLAKGLIETNQANCVLLLTGETYSKYIHPMSRSLRTIFGDAGTATIIKAENVSLPGLEHFIFGTDGKGFSNLIVRNGGARYAFDDKAELIVDETGNQWTTNNLVMNGPEIFNFTLRVVPNILQSLCEKSRLSIENIDFFIFHQANEFILDHLRRKMSVPKEKFFMDMGFCGNTVSNSIPIAIKRALNLGLIKGGETLFLVGFGVGYSWGGCLARLPQTI